MRPQVTLKYKSCCYFRAVAVSRPAALMTRLHFLPLPRTPFTAFDFAARPPAPRPLPLAPFAALGLGVSTTAITCHVLCQALFMRKPEETAFLSPSVPRLWPAERMKPQTRHDFPFLSPSQSQPSSRRRP